MGTASIAIVPFSPIFMTAPLPYCFSMLASARSSAFSLSLSCSTWRLLCGAYVRAFSVRGNASDPTKGV